jgi:hypothetical protein
MIDAGLRCIPGLTPRVLFANKRYKDVQQILDQVDQLSKDDL